MGLKRKVILADYSWHLYKSFHTPAFKEFTAEDKNGNLIPTNIHFGLCQFVKSVVSRDLACRLIFCRDAGMGGRNLLDPMYKSSRESTPEVYDHIDEIESILCLCPNVWFAKADGYEADDVMAQLAFEIKEKGEYVVEINSGDNDMLQMMEYGVPVTRKVRRGIFDYLDQDYVNEKWNPPKHQLDKYKFDTEGCYSLPYSRILRMRAFYGDTSDDIASVVPRLNRAFVRSFVEYWMRMPISQALASHPDRKR